MFRRIAFVITLAVSTMGSLTSAYAQQSGKATYLAADKLKFGSPEWVAGVTAALKKGYTFAGARLGEWHYYNNRDDEAIPLLKMALPSDPCVTALILGEIYRAKNDLNSFRPVMIKAANSGCAKAQYVVGTSYILGEYGLPVDYVLADKYLSLAVANPNSAKRSLEHFYAEPQAGKKSILTLARENLARLRNPVSAQRSDPVRSEQRTCYHTIDRFTVVPHPC